MPMNRFMELSSRKTSKRAIEPVDDWLQNEGFYRKHAPKDPTCLFRAVSEQVYQNQRCHIRVRKACVEYMRKNKQMFEEKISIPYESYLDQMACFTEWGGMNEILAMSLLFKRNVVVFHGQKLTRETIIDHGFKDSLYLCFTPLKQYETVYTQEYTANAGFCQSLVYQTLYKNVFKMNNVDATVHKMLHERSNHLRHDKFFLKGNIEIRNELTLELFDKIDDNGDSEELQLLSKGITPFPYRVAKALDPNIYRNVDYDIWHEIRREVRNSGYTKFNSTELQAGAKCLVQIDLKENDKVNNNFLSNRENWDNNTKAVVKPKRLEPLFYTGHIQEMSKNQGPVVVFIEELGEKMTVSYESLKPFPQRKPKQNNWSISSNKKNIITQNTKWKKPWNSTSRRVKDQMSNECTDKNQSNSKVTAKNVNKSEWSTETTLKNHSVKLQTENYSSYKEYNTNVVVDNVRTVLENSHLSPTETIEQTVVDKKIQKSTLNIDTYDTSSKKQTVTNFNHDVNQSNKQNNQQIEKNDIFYPPYPNNSYSPTSRFSGDSELIKYETIKNLDIDGNGLPISDPATVRHFFNLGVKYFWSQNMWNNGVNSPSFNDNSYYIAQSPDVNINTNIVAGSIPNEENISQANNSSMNNVRQNNRSSPARHRDQENVNGNGAKMANQKLNYRNSEFNNFSTTRDSHQSSNVDRNRADYKNSNSSDQRQQQTQQQQQISNSKESRVNKSNSVAPRFKRNFEGRNRSDHHNTQHQYRQQHQQEYEFRCNKKTIEASTITNQCEINEVTQMQQQQQQQQQTLQPHQQQHQQQSQQQPPMLQPQTPPPLANSYSYPLPYNQQVPYIPLGSYPGESEAFSGHYYTMPPGFVQVPYLAPSELSEAGNLGGGACGIPPVYPPMESFTAQYPPVYSQYVYHPPAIYPNQPPTAAIAENCYPPYQGQSYFFPYPPPPPPPPPPSMISNVGSANSQNPQSTPSH